MIDKKTILLALSLTAPATLSADVVIQNDETALTISDNGTVSSLIYKATGEECLQPGINAPVCVITQYRPYDNENFEQMLSQWRHALH